MYLYKIKITYKLFESLTKCCINYIGKLYNYKSLIAKRYIEFNNLLKIIFNFYKVKIKFYAAELICVIQLNYAFIWFSVDDTDFFFLISPWISWYFHFRPFPVNLRHEHRRRREILVVVVVSFEMSYCNPNLHFRWSSPSPVTLEQSLSM